MNIISLKLPKYSLKILTVAICCIHSLVLSSQASTLNYRILHKGKAMGSLQTTREIIKDTVKYNSAVDIEYHLLATIRIQHNNKTVYVNNSLWHSEVLSEVGKRGKDISETKKTTNGYIYSNNKDKPVSIKEAIAFSVERLFFDEPKGLTKVYSEEKGNFHRIENTRKNEYTKTAPNGHKSIYYYENGKLVKTHIDAGIIEFEMVLSD